MALNFFRAIWPDSSKPLKGRYQIVEQLGAGGFGQTFLAKDLDFPGQPFCVVKQLKPQVSSPEEMEVAQRLFNEEARFLSILGNHSQIPRLLAHFVEGQNLYLVQELIEGHSLSDELATGERWNDEAVVALLGDILGTLAFVHDQRVIHRDLKPSNLMRRRADHRIVLIDFGAVKEASTRLISSNTGITHTVSIGTQGYMPNEQLGGTPTFSSDIYAVGMIAIQALTGCHPRQLARDPRTGEIDWHPDATGSVPELVAVIDHMVKYDFRARYRTAGEALDALNALPEPLKQRIPSPAAWPATPGQGTSAARQDGVQHSSVLPVTHSEPYTLPSTRKHPGSFLPSPVDSDDVPPTQSSIDSPGDVADPSSQATLPVMGQNPSRDTASSATQVTQRLSGLPQSSSPQISPRGSASRLSSHDSFPKMLIPAGAIATLLALGLLTWRIVAPEPAATPNAALSSEQAEDSSTHASDGVPQQSAVTEEPDPSEAAALQQTLQQAQQFQDTNQYEQALAAYDEAIALDDTVSDAHGGRCYSLNKLGRYEEAVTACDRAIALDPDNAEALISKGYALDRQEQYADALALYDQALAINPNSAAAWSNKGTALLQLGDSQEAIAAYDRALELNPNLPEIWNNRGAALWDTRQFEAALESVERALELRPNYRDAAELRREMRKRLRRD